MTACRQLAAAIALAGLAGCSAQSSTPRWQTVWADEFDGATLDASKWTIEESCWGGGNNERQCYTSRAENVVVEDGVLKLKARPETYSGPLFPDHHDGAPEERVTRDYTSGKVMTLGAAAWKYGRVSARIKLPAGQGAWPAFWMMPADDAYGVWPLSGEIDIMESVNLETPCDECAGGVERRTSAALHFGDKAPNNTYRYAAYEAQSGASPASEWRVYSLEWGEGVLQWFVDDQIFMRLESDAWHTAADTANAHAPFDQPFYLLLNLAVGGNLPENSNGRGFEESTFPAELQIDWVRVEQCLDDVKTGLACMSDQEWDGTPLGPWENQAS